MALNSQVETSPCGVGRCFVRSALRNKARTGSSWLLLRNGRQSSLLVKLRRVSECSLDILKRIPACLAIETFILETR